MSLRRSLSPNQKFSLIIVSVVAVIAAETAGLFVLNQQHPAPSEAPAPSDTPALAVKPSDSAPTDGTPSDRTTLAAAPTSTPEHLFTAPGVEPPAGNGAPNTPNGRGTGGFVAPPASGNGGNNLLGGTTLGKSTPPRGIPGLVAPPATAHIGGKDDLSGKATGKESPEKAKAREQFARGVDALNRKDARGAIDAFEQVVALVPSNLPSQINLASLYLSTRQPKLALGHLQTAAKLAPKSAAIQFNIARTLLTLGRPNDALGALKKTVHLAPAERDGHILLGQVLLQTRRPKDAYVQFKIAAQNDKRDVEAHVMAASLANDALHQPKEAENWLRRAIEGAPRSPQPALLLGRLLMGERRFKDAATVLTSATRANPGVFEFYPMLANARSGSGDTNGAVAALHSALSRLPKGKNADEQARINFVAGGLHLTLGQTLGDSKKIKAALAEFQQAAKLRPTDPQPRSLAAIASLQLKDEAGAIRLLQDAIHLDPRRTGDRRILAQLYIDAKRWKDADTQLAQCARSAPKDMATLVLWARVARAAKDSKRERQVVQRITEVAPSNPLGWAQLGLLQRQAGDRKAALATFSRLAALAPSDPNPRFEMARLQSELGDFEGAFASWQKVVRNKPDYAPVYSSLLQAGDEAKERVAARSFLVRQLSGRPENVPALKEILGFYDAQKRPDEARAFLNDLLARNPKFTATKAALDSFGSSDKPDASKPTTPKPEATKADTGKSDADTPTATPAKDAAPADTDKPEE